LEKHKDTFDPLKHRGTSVLASFVRESVRESVLASVLAFGPALVHPSVTESYIFLEEYRQQINHFSCIQMEQIHPYIF